MKIQLLFNIHDTNLFLLAIKIVIATQIYHINFCS